jgi:la-related protein 1
MASTFSYAQAAKGVSASAATSKQASGSATPAKEANSAPSQDPNAATRSWAEDVETASLPDQPAKAHEALPERSASNAAKVAQPVDASNVSSPELGALSSSTVTKDDDDVRSIPNTASESTTWDNKSQASTSVDKSVEPVEKTSDKVKKGKTAVAKALQEAPVPTVNPWKLRADEMKAKVQKVAPSVMVNGASHGPNGVQQKKGDSAPQEKTTNGDSRNKSREVAQGRKDAKGDADNKSSAKGRSAEKEAKAASAALPPPPNRDQESWPTPEIAIDEDRKKAQEKGDKVEKERKDGASVSKHEWVKVPFTPSVVFNTPLPNAANARRGGRLGGRGGAQTGGRPTGVASNGAEQAEKDGSASGVVPNGEQTRRERPETATRETSPKPKRNGSAASPTLREQLPVVNGNGAAKANGPVASEGEAQHRRSSVSSQMPGQNGQNGTYARQYPNKPNKGRRGEFHGAGERRRDGAGSPTKDNTWDERRVSAGTQTDAFGDGERRAPTYQDGSHGYHSKRFSSFSSNRERGGGRGRGSRGGYINGHQFTNGHPSSGFPLRSPTTFVPDNGSFFPPHQGKYRNSHRSQSLTTDPYRFTPYQNGGYSIPPIQTSQDMYNYGMPQPMSAGLPYSPYGVDQTPIMALIAGQVYVYKHLMLAFLLTLL